jgi:uncharacterized protein YukE
MSFMHPELQAAAEQLQTLQAAGQQVGAPDPVLALRHMDCAPPAVAKLATAVGAGAPPLSDAAETFQEGVVTAEQGWEGPAAEAFARKAEAMNRFYGDTRVQVEHTTAAGRQIADGLDALARSTAAQAIAIAQDAEEASLLVLSGLRQPAIVETVNNACTDVVRVVQQHVAEIPSLGAGLVELASPLPTPAG